MIKLPNQAKLDFYQAEIDAHLAELEVELEKMKNEDLALKIGRVIFLLKVRMGTLQEGLETGAALMVLCGLPAARE